MNSEEYYTLASIEDWYWWHVVKKYFVSSLVEKLDFQCKPNILDIGCGAGGNLQLLSKVGAVQGIDQSKLALKLCQKQGLRQVSVSDASSLPYPANTFDLISILDVLYHRAIVNDVAVLAEAQRVLKPEGYLIVTDCAYPFLYGPHDRSNHARQRYYKKELNAKIGQAGLTVIRSSYYFCFTFPFFLVQRVLSKLLYQPAAENEYKISRLFNTLLCKAGYLESRCFSRVDLPVGSSIIVLAQKL